MHSQSPAEPNIARIATGIRGVDTILKKSFDLNTLLQTVAQLIGEGAYRDNPSSA